ncbi:MAG TPA: hypothetical protein VI749_04700 [Candidatus Omnitrophota bacterium]|nr:hypothetical protein [Candidatus Omnitrophota bacterium]
MAEEKQVTEIDKKCAFTGKAIKRVKRYYRNGLYFLNKAAFQGWLQKKKEDGAAATVASEAPAAAEALAKKEAAPKEAKAEPKAEEKAEEKKG